MAPPDAEPPNDDQAENAASEQNEASQLQTMRLHAVVHGRVQGVGFRANTQRAASQVALTGWVRNQWDGTVEVVAEGPRAVLERFEHFLHQGPRAAQVDRVELTYETATGEFSRFSVRY